MSTGRQQSTNGGVTWDVKPLQCAECAFIGKNMQSLRAHLWAKHKHRLGRVEAGLLVTATLTSEPDIAALLGDAQRRLEVRLAGLGDQIGVLTETRTAVRLELSKISRAHSAYINEGASAASGSAEMPAKVAVLSGVGPIYGGETGSGPQS